jgi:hypothetical protein
MDFEGLKAFLTVIQALSTVLVLFIIRPLLRLEARLTRIETALRLLERCDICPFKRKSPIPLPDKD